MVITFNGFIGLTCCVFIRETCHIKNHVGYNGRIKYSATDTIYRLKLSTLLKDAATTPLLADCWKYSKVKNVYTDKYYRRSIIGAYFDLKPYNAHSYGLNWLSVDGAVHAANYIWYQPKTGYVDIWNYPTWAKKVFQNDN